MVLIEELVPRADYPKELHDLTFWEMCVEDVSRAHLLGFFYRAKLLSGREIATQLSERIADAISEHNRAGIVRNNRVDQFKIEQPPMLSGELRQALEMLPLTSRRCAYFALLMDWDLERAIDLTWSQFNSIRTTEMVHDAALDVTESMPRHFRSKLVFWTQDEWGAVSKVQGLKADLEIAFSMSFDQLREKFHKMVLIDPQSCLDDFEEMIQTPSNNQEQEYQYEWQA